MDDYIFVIIYLTSKILKVHVLCWVRNGNYYHQPSAPALRWEPRGCGEEKDSWWSTSELKFLIFDINPFRKWLQKCCFYGSICLDSPYYE